MNAAIIRAGSTVTVNPRHGAYRIRSRGVASNLRHSPSQTIENAHLFDVHLGETVVPYAMLQPLKALLPIKRGDHPIT